MTRAEWNQAWVGMWAELGNTIVNFALVAAVTTYLMQSDDFMAHLHRCAPLLAEHYMPQRNFWLRMRAQRDAQASGGVASS